MSALTAFVLIDPVTKLVMEAIDTKKKEVTVRLEHKDQPKAAEQPKHLKLYERADGSRYSTGVLTTDTASASTRGTSLCPGKP